MRALGVIVVGPLPNLMKTKATVEPHSGKICFVDFKKQRFGAIRMQFSQYRIHQTPAKPFPPSRASYCNGEYLRFARRLARNAWLKAKSPTEFYDSLQWLYGARA